MRKADIEIGAMHIVEFVGYRVATVLETGLRMDGRTDGVKILLHEDVPMPAGMIERHAGEEPIIHAVQIIEGVS